MKECVRSKDHSRNASKSGSEALVYHVSHDRSESRRSAGTGTEANIALAGTRIFGVILLEGFCLLIVHITKAHQTHRMRPSPMDLRHARKM